MDPNALSVLPGYSHLFSERKVVSLLVCQFTFCLMATVLITFYIMSRVFQSREKAFHDALRLMKPLQEKVGDLDVQRQILNAYLDNTEDKCNVHYALLHSVTRDKAEGAAPEVAASGVSIESKDGMAASNPSLVSAAEGEADAPLTSTSE